MVLFKVALGTSWHKRNLQLHHSGSIIADAWESYTQSIFHSFRFVQLYEPTDFHTSPYNTLNYLLFRALELNSSAYSVFHSLSWCPFRYVLYPPQHFYYVLCVLLIYPPIVPEIKLPLKMQMDGNRKRFTEWGKPDPKRGTRYVFTHKWILTII